LAPKTRLATETKFVRLSRLALLLRCRPQLQARLLVKPEMLEPAPASHKNWETSLPKLDLAHDVFVSFSLQSNDLSNKVETL
jgi:hypothetical protein